MSPYIKEEDRIRVLAHGESAQTPGELNYKITKEILRYLSNLNYNKLVKSKKMSAVNSYTDYNEVIGVLECCKLELYRKMIAKYEDLKCKLNGEVYG